MERCIIKRAGHTFILKEDPTEFNLMMPTEVNDFIEPYYWNRESNAVAILMHRFSTFKDASSRTIDLRDSLRFSEYLDWCESCFDSSEYKVAKQAQIYELRRVDGSLLYEHDTQGLIYFFNKDALILFKLRWCGAV